jgi:predicted metal-dependent peptidase
MDAAICLARARLVLRKHVPYITTVVQSLTPVEVPWVPTIGVTKGHVLMYNNTFVSGMATERESDICGLLLHETMHILRDTQGRKGDRDPERWNTAADLAINSGILAMHNAAITVPPITSKYAGCYPADFKFPEGLTHEEYYRLLEDTPDPTGSSGSGDGDGDAVGNSANESNGKDTDGKEPRPMNGHCGSGAGNPINKEEEEKLDDTYGRGAIEKKVIQKQAAEALRKYQEGRGHLPGLFSGIIEEILSTPKISWRKLLSAQVRSSLYASALGNDDTTYLKVSRRTFVREDTDVIMPGTIGYDPKVLVCLDTSGSMHMGLLREALSETAGIIKKMGGRKVWFIQADADVQEDAKEIRLADLKNMTILGRGGTDFRPTFAYAETKMRPRPDILIYMTDGDGYAPTAPPKGIRTVWCIVASYRKTPPAPWGKTVYIES